MTRSPGTTRRCRRCSWTGWQFLDPTADTSAADVTVTLVELFAHLGDLLHYRLDRIATEAWLSTARRRASVVRHARAVDFAVQPAISAATTVQVVVAAAAGSDPQATVQPGDTATDAAGTVTPDASCFTVEAAGPQIVRSSHAEVALYDWMEDDAVLGAGATSAVLVRPLAAAGVAAQDWLPAGSLLGFEVVGVDDVARQRSWVAGLVPAPADVMPRPPLASGPAQVVTVTAVTEFTDPLQPGPDLLRVFWDPSQALQAPVPCSVDQSAGAVVGVARLGLLPAHHGLLVDGPGTLAPIDPLTSLAADPLTTQVSDYLLVSAGPEGAPGLSHAPGGRPWQLEVTVALANGTQVQAGRVTSMLRAPAAGFSVVVDADDEMPARMRFSTGALGLVPPAGSTVSARYQVGAGLAGNVGANITSRLVRCMSAPGVPCAWQDVTDDHNAAVAARNVTPGSAGAAAMSLDDVRRDAPQAYSAVLRRAVLIGDLAPFAAEVPSVLRAAASRSWSGSWPVGVVTYEPVSDGREGEADPAAAALLQAQVQSTLDAVRMAGTEVVAVTATPVGILIALTVCLYPGSDPDAARAAILASLRPGTPDAPGLFAPGSFPMGTDVYLSHVVATVAAVPYVDAVAVTEARLRLGSGRHPRRGTGHGPRRGGGVRRRPQCARPRPDPAHRGGRLMTEPRELTPRPDPLPGQSRLRRRLADRLALRDDLLFRLAATPDPARPGKTLGDFLDVAGDPAVLTVAELWSRVADGVLRLHRDDRGRGLPRHRAGLDRRTAHRRPRGLPARPAHRGARLRQGRYRARRVAAGPGGHPGAGAGHAQPSRADVRGRRRHAAAGRLGRADGHRGARARGADR